MLLVSNHLCWLNVPRLVDITLNIGTNHVDHCPSFTQLTAVYCSVFLHIEMYRSKYLGIINNLISVLNSIILDKIPYIVNEIQKKNSVQLTIFSLMHIWQENKTYTKFCFFYDGQQLNRSGCTSSGISSVYCSVTLQAGLTSYDLEL